MQPTRTNPILAQVVVVLAACATLLAAPAVADSAGQSAAPGTQSVTGRVTAQFGISVADDGLSADVSTIPVWTRRTVENGTTVITVVPKP